MKYIKSKVVMLPTGNASQFTIFKSEYGLFRGSSIDIEDFNEGDKSYQPQHLYFLSDEEIKEGDWFINSFSKAIYRGSKYDVETIKSMNAIHTKKIIATTNDSLKTEYDGTTPISKDWSGKSLPRPSNEFLKKYCELGGVDEVLVGYEQGKVLYKVWGLEIPAETGMILKVAPDNTITIKPIKDSWNREEVIDLIRKSHEDHHEHPNDLETWIKENL